MNQVDLKPTKSINMALETTYRVKGKSVDVVLLFKYDLNSNLKLFEISEGQLTDVQLKWLFGQFPVNENDMTAVWMKSEKYTKFFDIEKSPADLSFEALWNLYGYKESRKDAEKFFNKLTEQEKIKCFIQVPKYKKKIAQTSIAQALLATYINKQRFNDEYTEPKSTKNYNPVLQDLAKQKTDRR